MEKHGPGDKRERRRFPTVDICLHRARAAGGNDLFALAAGARSGRGPWGPAAGSVEAAAAAAAAAAAGWVRPRGGPGRGAWRRKALVSAGGVNGGAQRQIGEIQGSNPAEACQRNQPQRARVWLTWRDRKETPMPLWLKASGTGRSIGLRPGGGERPRLTPLQAAHPK